MSTYRAKQRRPAEVSVDQVTERDLANGATRLSTSHRCVEAEVLDALPDNEIKAALATLPHGTRTVMYYVAVQGYTYAEPPFWASRREQ